MSMQLLIRCSACDKPAPNEGKVRPDVQRETGLVVLSPPAGGFAVLDTAPTKAPTMTSKEAASSVRASPPRTAATALCPRRSCPARTSTCAWSVASPARAGCSGRSPEGLPAAFGDFDATPAPRGAMNYRAPVLSLRVTAALPGNVRITIDRALLQETHETEATDTRA